MTYDLLIKNGTIIDGSGAPAFSGNIAVKEGKIAAVGETTDDAKQIIDASGHLVTPGFVDIHTHYDGQATWTSELTPSSNHDPR